MPKAPHDPSDGLTRSHAARRRGHASCGECQLRRQGALQSPADTATTIGVQDHRDLKAFVLPTDGIRLGETANPCWAVGAVRGADQMLQQANFSAQLSEALTRAGYEIRMG